MKATTILFLAFAALAVGAVLALPPAAAEHCGVGITENSHEPTDTTFETMPLIQVVFDDTGSQCGVWTLSVIVDGVDVSEQASVSKSASPPQYTVSYQPQTETAPGAGHGPHTVSVTLTEGCCNNIDPNDGRDVGTASWSYTIHSIADPTFTDNPDGSCTLWNDANNDGNPDPEETPLRAPCPNPRTQPAPGGQTTIYDDKNNNEQMDPGENVWTTDNAKVYRHGNGSCTAYNDVDNDNVVDAGEQYAPPFPCPNPRTTRGPGISTIVYDDKDQDGQMDPGEEIARTPNPFFKRNPNGTCTILDDRDSDGTVDPGEAILTFPCPLVKTANNPDGTTTVYDDKDNDNTVDSDETIITLGARDADHDAIPDDLEAELCGRPLYRELLSSLSPNAGECASSTDYVAPTRFGGVNLPTQMIPGADLDNDDFPETVTLKRQRLIFQPFHHERVVFEPATDLVLPVDPDDANPNVPVLSTVVVPFPVVSSWTFGDDNDKDKVPVNLTLEKTWYTYDRGAPTTLGRAPAPSDHYPMDPDDSDKNVPAQSVFGPIKVPTSAYGMDVDGDRIPGTITVTYLDVTVDRTADNPISTNTHTETFQLDPDDGTRGAPPVNLDAYDGDRDDLPDAMEEHLCKAQDDNRPWDGDCVNGTDYRAPAAIPNPWRRS